MGSYRGGELPKPVGKETEEGLSILRVVKPPVLVPGTVQTVKTLFFAVIVPGRTLILI